jgi:hypothetical protein
LSQKAQSDSENSQEVSATDDDDKKPKSRWKQLSTNNFIPSSIQTSKKGMTASTKHRLSATRRRFCGERRNEMTVHWRVWNHVRICIDIHRLLLPIALEWLCYLIVEDDRGCRELLALKTRLVVKLLLELPVIAWQVSAIYARKLSECQAQVDFDDPRILRVALQRYCDSCLWTKLHAALPRTLIALVGHRNIPPLSTVHVALQ